MIRVRFAPTSLDLGDALGAVLARRFADEHGGRVLLRIDRSADALVADLEWLGVAWDEGPVQRSERFVRHREAAHLIGEPDAEGALVFEGVTLLRPDGTPTDELASAVDDLDFEVTHVTGRSNAEVESALIVAVGGEPPEYIHHGSLLDPLSVAELRDQGFPFEAVRRYLEELGLPRDDVHVDLPRLRRLSIEALGALSDEELAARVGVPVSVAPVLRGSRDLREAAEYAAHVLEPASAAVDAPETLARFRELVEGGLDAKSVVRELKAVGGDLRALRLALTGRERGPELWAIVAALPREETLRRVDAAL